MPKPNVLKALTALEIQDEQKASTVSAALETLFEAVGDDSTKLAKALGVEAPAPAPVVDEKAPLEKQIESLKAEVAKAEAKDGADAALVMVMKSTLATLESTNTALKATQDNLAVEKAARQHREYLEKATTLKALPGTTEEIAKSLRAVDALADGDVKTSLNKLLTDANARIAELTKTAGRDGDGDPNTSGTVQEEVQKGVTAIIEKNAGMTRGEALVKLFEDDHDLYVKYQQERFSQPGMSAGGA